MGDKGRFHGNIGGDAFLFLGRLFGLGLVFSGQGRSDQRAQEQQQHQNGFWLECHKLEVGQGLGCSGRRDHATDGIENSRPRVRMQVQFNNPRYVF